MGSQWPGMGAELMEIPIFSASIERCRKALELKGIDIVHIITSTEPGIFNNILNAFVGIAAIQIGLTDILRSLGLIPDNIIGHSVGELGCAYADGCLTAEEMILAAYSRGQASIETNLINGSMAAIGMGYRQILPICPPEIDVACHNGPDSSTISGPKDAITQFVAELTTKGIFAKTVPSANIAYHSRYIADAGENLLKLLKAVIKNPRPRSNRWISTSVPRDNWNDPVAKNCSAEYQTNNLLSPVLFEETSQLIPSDAIVIEIAPRGLLQAILKRSLPSNCFNISLTKSGSGNILHFLHTIGKLYMEGCLPDIKALYPKVDFPVSTGTPMLSHLVEWMHVEEWYVPKPLNTENICSAICEYFISVHDEEHKYLRGNVSNGKMMYPIGGILMLVWDTLSMSMSLPKRKISVRFLDLFIDVQPALYEEKILKLRVAINKGDGQFEVTNDGSKVASGIVLLVSKNIFGKETHTTDTPMTLNTNDFYQLLKEKGYSYSEDFRLIKSVNLSLSKAMIEWRDNWVTLIENMLQLVILNQNYDGVLQPTQINRIVIDTIESSNQTFTKHGKSMLKVNFSNICGLIQGPGVYIKDIQFRESPRTPYPISLLVPSSEEKGKLINFKSVTSSYTNAMLQSAETGNVNSLHWTEVSEPSGSGVLVKVHYASLSNYDGKKASGTVPHRASENYYGIDFSGIAESGSRVMGIVHRGACRNYVRAHPDLLWPVPDHWSLEDAATVPLAYAYAFYCLAIKAKLCAGMKILIHEGAGALGQAVIAIALAHKCQVFTTVGDLRTKRFLKKLFPELKEEHIGNSRDITFGDMVLTATNGKGCDIIISNVETSLKNVSLQCGNYQSVIFDTEQIEKRENFELRMNSLINDRSYVTTKFESIFEFWNSEEIKNLQILMNEGISSGYVRPLARVSYSSKEAPRAFRLLCKNWHRGHILLRLTEQVLPAQPRISCRSECSQLIICSEEDFGIQLANRLVSRGATKIHICSPKVSWYLQHKTDNLKSIGVNVIVSTNIIKDSYDTTFLLKKTIAMGPLEGIYVANFRNDDETLNILQDIGNMSKDLFPLLRCFAVITNNMKVVEKTCISGVNEYPIISVIETRRPQINENEKHAILDKGAWNLSTLDALETGLRCKVPLLVAQGSTYTSPLYQQLAASADIPSLEDANDVTTLRELSVGSENIKIVKEFLRQKYHKCFLEQEILELNKQKLEELDSLQNGFEKKEGLAVYLSHIAKDELNSNALVYSLPTLGNTTTEKLSEAIESEYLSIVLGIENNFERFCGICERLKLPALVLQPRLDRTSDTIQQTAEKCSKLITEQIGVRKSFYLLASDIGILIAMELAAIFESNGILGTVFCLGSAPEDVKPIIERELAAFTTEDQLQLEILKHIFKLLTANDPSDLEKALPPLSSWNEKIESCIKMMTGQIAQTKQYVEALIQSVYAKILSIKQYDSSTLPILKSRVIVLRSPDCSIISSPSSYSIEDLSAPLSDATTDTRCAAIINKNLSSEILEEFDKKNLCDTFLISFDEKYTKVNSRVI
ncbi:fatty acid synthase-like [Bombyx mandarina]|uniref:Fatty acid synthase-like n=1 Tax=Bombyx mandarina TaxID=7092 RepID=A0A6J2JBR3_BOMMA|nr:fatty acid synthase-like [Bombyx mandarina]